MYDGFVADQDCFEWLTKKQGGWQFGEQEVLYAAGNQICTWGDCIEIGAGNGKSLPLTIDPFNYGSNTLFLFEADPESASLLKSKYPDASVQGRFDVLLLSQVNKTPLVCVIDVDGIDREIMLDVLRCKTPSILMVEHLDKFHYAHCTQSDPLPDWTLGLEMANGYRLQDNEAAINRIAKMFDYTRLGTTRVNSIFVHNQYVEKLKR